MGVREAGEISPLFLFGESNESGRRVLCWYGIPFQNYRYTPSHVKYDFFSTYNMTFYRWRAGT